MIEIARGLEHSFKILKFLQRDKDLRNIEIYVRCFMNCRECGLTFTIYPDRLKSKSKTFCIYEHRNSDTIIINSKENWTGFSDDLPYKSGSKYDYDKEFSRNEDKKCYEWLKQEILKITKKKEKNEAL